MGCRSAMTVADWRGFPRQDVKSAAGPDWGGDVHARPVMLGRYFEISVYGGCGALSRAPDRDRAGVQIGFSACTRCGLAGWHHMQ